MKKNITKELKVKLLRICLVPLARFCLRNSIKLQEIIRILKEVLVIEASSLLQKDRVEISSSKISVITGVHRKDSSTILDGNSLDDTERADLLTKVLGQWQVDKQFASKGIPKELSCVGKSSEFSELVKKVNKEINPYTILFELERAGLIRKNETSVTLLAKEYIPLGDAENVFKIYKEDGSDLISAIENNSINQKEKHFHLRTQFDNIPEECLGEIHEWIFKEGDKFHKKVREKLSKYDRDTSNKKSKNKLKNSQTVRVAITLFEFSENIKNNDKE